MMTARLAAPAAPWQSTSRPGKTRRWRKKIPCFKKAELKADGVTFLSDDEGVSAFLREVDQRLGRSAHRPRGS